MKNHLLILTAVFALIGQWSFAQTRIYGTTSEGGQGFYGTFYHYDVNSASVLVDHSMTGIPGQAHSANSLVYAGNDVYYGLGAWIHSPYSNNYGSLFQFNTATGEFEVLAELESDGPLGHNPRHNLVLHNNNLYFQTHTKIVRYDLATSSMTAIVDFEDGDLFTWQPNDRMDLLLIGNALYFVSGDQWYAGRNYIYKYDLDTETGSLVYENPTALYFNTARVDGDLIYIGSSNSLAVYNTVTNTYSLLTTLDGTTGTVPNSISVDGDFLYVQTTQGGANNNGTLFKYDMNLNVSTVLINYYYSPTPHLTPYGGGRDIVVDGTILKMVHRHDFANHDGNSVWLEYDLTTDEVQITSMGLRAESEGMNLHYSTEVNAYVFMGRNGIYIWDEVNSELTVAAKFGEADDFGFMGSSRVREGNTIYGFAKKSWNEGDERQFVYAHNIEDNSLVLLDDLVALVNEPNTYFEDVLVLKDNKLYGYVLYGSGGMGPIPPYTGDVLALHETRVETQVAEYSRSISRHLFSYDIATGQLDLIHEFTDGMRWFQALIEDNGVLYGNCSAGGANNEGALFAFDLADNSFSLLHAFATGYNPWQWIGNIAYLDGKLYGAIPYTDEYDAGILYAYDLTSSTFEALHAVDGSVEGEYPFSILAHEDLVYVMSYEDENGQGGFVWAYDPADETIEVLASLDYAIHGSYPGSNPIIANDVMYFATDSDGEFGYGAVLALDLADNSLDVVLSHGPQYGGIYYYQGTNLIAVDFCEFANYDVTLSMGTLTAYPVGATYAWVNCDAPGTVVATTQSFTPESSGDYKVTITNGNCVVETDCIEVTVSGVGLNANEQNTLNIYPNPATTLVNLAGLEIGSVVDVIDFAGRTVETRTAQTSEMKINTSSYAQGVYFIKVSNAQGVISKKLIKQ
jgi:uncharacterized repeat protein (TIGR03803 family)